VETTLPTNSDLSTIERLAHTHLADCYQCGKCTAGCPMGARMEIAPTRIVRLLQLGDADRALRADSIWECVSCQTCSTRCPKSVDCCGIMDALRELAAARGTVSPARQRVLAFQKAFLGNVKRNGRLAEMELIAAFKLAAFQQDRNFQLLMKDATLAPQLQKRHKLHLKGETVADRGVVRRIFERCEGGAE
jgi:heterodisulfide reductase subunit C